MYASNIDSAYRIPLIITVPMNQVKIITNCDYMIWKEVADILEVGELTHKLRTHTRRLIHELSLATRYFQSWTSIDFHRAPGSLVYKDKGFP